VTISDNDLTLYAYENGVKDYNAVAIPDVTGAVKAWIDAGLAMLSANAVILELGSAHGRDADYIESRGFVINRTDAAQSFVNYMESRGHKAQLLNALTADYGGPYDMVYANAVLVHFTHKECGDVLQRTKKALKPNGLFSFSVKVGEGSGWSNGKLKDPRFFTYWQLEPLKTLLKQNHYELVYWEESKTGHNAGNWFHIIARTL
jgi:predicted TPR repeat methyltransferase